MWTRLTSSHVVPSDRNWILVCSLGHHLSADNSSHLIARSSSLPWTQSSLPPQVSCTSSCWSGVGFNLTPAWSDTRPVVRSQAAPKLGNGCTILLCLGRSQLSENLYNQVGRLVKQLPPRKEPEFVLTGIWTSTWVFIKIAHKKVRNATYFYPELITGVAGILNMINRQLYWP